MSNPNLNPNLNQMIGIPTINKIPMDSLIPSYIENKPPFGILKLYIVYKNPEKVGIMHKKIIDYKPLEYDTINKLKELISNELKVDNFYIKLLPHPELKQQNFLNIINDEFRGNLLLKNIINVSCNFIIVEVFDPNTKKQDSSSLFY